MRILPSLDFSLVEVAGNEAIEYCGDHPQYSVVSEVVFELMLVHRDWLNWMNGGESRYERVDDYHRELCIEFSAMLSLMDNADMVEDRARELSEILEKASAGLTPLQNKVFKIMLTRQIMHFNDLRPAWSKDVTEYAIESILKEIKKRLNPSLWQFSISRDHYKVTWEKRPDKNI